MEMCSRSEQRNYYVTIFSALDSAFLPDQEHIMIFNMPYNTLQARVAPFPLLLPFNHISS